MNHSVVETKAGIRPSLLKGSPLVGQAWMSHLTCSHSYWCSSVQLFFRPFQAGAIFPSVMVPDSSLILLLRADKCIVGCLSHLLVDQSRFWCMGPK